MTPAIPQTKTVTFCVKTKAVCYWQGSFVAQQHRPQKQLSLRGVYHRLWRGLEARKYKSNAQFQKATKKEKIFRSSCNFRQGLPVSWYRLLTVQSNKQLQLQFNIPEQLLSTQTRLCQISSSLSVESKTERCKQKISRKRIQTPSFRAKQCEKQQKVEGSNSLAEMNSIKLNIVLIANKSSRQIAHGHQANITVC